MWHKIFQQLVKFHSYILTNHFTSFQMNRKFVYLLAAWTNDGRKNQCDILKVQSRRTTV